MMSRQVRFGKGWRLGWHPHAEQFKGLVAGDTWAIELTAAEFQDFVRLTQQLSATMSAMAEQIMDEETLSCEQETENIWVEASGFPHHYGLRFMLLTGRRTEGEWPASIVPELIEALSKSPFNQMTDL